MGFYARGNCGDEALLQCAYEAFKDDFDIVLIVDEHGAREGWWDWYPYVECQRVHHSNLSFVLRKRAGLIIGGGGLGIGFGANQAVAARSVGTPTFLAGTDHTHFNANAPQLHVDAARQYMALFDHVFLRSSLSVQRASEDGIEAGYGADWAFRLPTDKSDEVTVRPDRCLVTIREWPPEIVDQDFFVHSIRTLLSTIRAADMNPVLLPFSPEDERFMGETGIDQLAATERHWWNPRRAKQLIKSSALMLSVGRLHPTIFALAANVPTAQIIPPISADVQLGRFQKMGYMAEEFAIPFVPVDEVGTVLGSRSLSAESRDKVADAEHRLNAMISTIRAHLAS
jgi:polysaccharide pyruvyl transferase WcaK-like protein